MGDVLAGMLAALLGQGLNPEEAMKLGVYLHGFVGDRVGGGKGPNRAHRVGYYRRPASGNTRFIAGGPIVSKFRQKYISCAGGAGG